MSKDIIPLPATPGATIKVKPGTQIAWSQEPRTLYSRGLLPRKIYHKFIEGPAELVGLGIGAATGTITMVASAMLAGFNSSGTTNLDVSWGMLALLGPAAVGSLAGVIPGFKQRRTRRAMETSIIAGFSNWVNERYNLHTTPGTFNRRHVVWIMENRTVDGSDQFQSDGKTFKIRFDPNWYIYIEENTPKPIPDYRPDASIAAVEAVNAEDAVLKTDLTGEAAVLAGKILSLLNMLANRDLAPEHSHVAKRVREDLQTTLDLHRSLLELGTLTDESQQLIISTLTDLGAELDGLVVAERASVNRELLVQQRYIRDRKEAATHPALKIEPTNETAPATTKEINA